MRKVAIIGVILLLTASMVFAAGNRQAASSDKVNITYSFWGSNDEITATQSIIDRYNAMQNRIEVKIEHIPNETYIQNLNTRAIAGNLPNCGMMDERGVLGFAERGLLADVSNMYGMGETKPLDSVAFRSSDGRVVAYSGANEILMLFYNRALFDRAGIPYPSPHAANAMTWDQFVDLAKRLTLDSSGRNATQAGFDRNNIVQYGAAVEAQTWQLEAWAISNGGGIYAPNGKDIIIGSDAAIEAIQRVADLHLVHNVAPLNLGTADSAAALAFSSGNIAMATGGHWSIGAFFPDSAVAGRFGVAPLPYMRERVTMNTAGPTVVFNTGTIQQRAAAMEFLKWYTDYENGGTWFLVEIGIWMPNLESYYTNETLTRKWLTSGRNYPPYEESKAAIVDYTLQYARPAGWYYTPNVYDIENVLTSALGPVWTGQQTARQAITAALPAMRRALAGH